MTIERVLAAINLKDHDLAIAIYLITRRVLPRAFCLVAPGNNVRFHILQTKFADEECFVATILFRIRRRVPNVDLILSEFDIFNLTCRARYLARFFDTRSCGHFSCCCDPGLPVFLCFLTSFIE